MEAGDEIASRAETKPVVLFDGGCNLCDGTINFIARRDPRGSFRFAALESAAGRELLRKHGLDSARLDSVVLIEGGRAYTHSTAALRIAERIGGAWSLLHVLAVVPRGLRDRVYSFVARNRFKWFGRRQACERRSPEVSARLLG